MALAKTTRPTLAPTTVARPRLFRLLDRARRKPVTWVWGPPGAGKTTLVVSYLQARKVRTLWYQLDEGDADVATFFYYLGVAAPRRRRPLPLLTSQYRPGLGLFARRCPRSRRAGVSSSLAGASRRSPSRVTGPTGRSTFSMGPSSGSPGPRPAA